MHAISREPFRTILATTIPAGVATTVAELDLAIANLGARAVAIGSTYEFFRLAKLHVYQYTNCCGPVFDADAAGGTGTEGQLGAEHAVAFVESNATDTGTATTFTQMAQYEMFKCGNVYKELSLNVPRDLLQGNPLKWYNTASTGAPADSLSPGLVIVGAGNALSIVSGWENLVRTVVEGVIEFRGRITPALSFAESKLAVPTVPISCSSSSSPWEKVPIPIPPPGYRLVRQEKDQV